MLATLTHEPLSDEDWIYERKLDGERCLAFRHGNAVRLLSRNRKELNATYPELVCEVGSPSEPTTASCATPATSACAATRTQTT